MIVCYIFVEFVVTKGRPSGPVRIDARLTGDGQLQNEIMSIFITRFELHLPTSAAIDTYPIIHHDPHAHKK